MQINIFSTFLEFLWIRFLVRFYFASSHGLMFLKTGMIHVWYMMYLYHNHVQYVILLIWKIKRKVPRLIWRERYHWWIHFSDGRLLWNHKKNLESYHLRPFFPTFPVIYHNIFWKEHQLPQILPVFYIFGINYNIFWNNIPLPHFLESSC